MGYPQPTTPMLQHSITPLPFVPPPIDKPTRAAIGSVAPATPVQEGVMECINLGQKIDEARAQKIKNSHFFGTDNFRTWMLYFEPGDDTPMHFHQNPETFLVVRGECSIKDLKGGERVVKKDDIVFFAAKEYYQLINKGTEPLVLFGNRSEPFGIGITRAEATK